MARGTQVAFPFPGSQRGCWSGPLERALHPLFPEQPGWAWAGGLHPSQHQQKDQQECILAGVTWRKGRNGRCRGEGGVGCPWAGERAEEQGTGEGRPQVDVETVANEEQSGVLSVVGRERPRQRVPPGKGLGRGGLSELSSVAGAQKSLGDPAGP